MKKNFTAISVVLDRSGSMNLTLESTITGFNEFVKTQKEANIGECVLSLHQFDDNYQTDYTFTPINEVPELTTETFVPRGMTALHDAIGKTINELGVKLASMAEDERPDSVIVAILTDGMENASKEFSSQKVNEMIREQTDTYNWEFVFLAANQDAIATASNYGIASGSAMTYAGNDLGTKAAFSSVGGSISRRRGLRAASYAGGASVSEAAEISKAHDFFTDEDRKTQSEAGA